MRALVMPGTLGLCTGNTAPLQHARNNSDLITRMDTYNTPPYGNLSLAGIG